MCFLDPSRAPQASHYGACAHCVARRPRFSAAPAGKAIPGGPAALRVQRRVSQQLQGLHPAALRAQRR
eukprot:13885930-Alexandrium_andersonii.AAC.1